tara:strand:- start:84 stop:398 length:315 start_codon:yes stop_codon:yes gene_type:complete
MSFKGKRVEGMAKLLDNIEGTAFDPWREDCVMVPQAYDWIMVDDGGPMQGYYYCHLENMTLYRRPGKRPMYFTAVAVPYWMQSSDYPTIEAAISDLDQQLSLDQ